MDPTLKEILDARETRAQTQKALLTHYQKPLICFTMNIPGPVKLDRDISIGFFVGTQLLEKVLPENSLAFRQVHYKNTGCEGYYAVDMPAKAMKQLAVCVEDTDPIGRLFDIDVLDTDGRKITREELGFGRRKCLLCNQDAVICAGRRAHGLDRLLEQTRHLLELCAEQWLPVLIADQAWLALNQELTTTPKPGLVDRNNTGSHKDMGLRHFFASANALRPFFARFASQGHRTCKEDPKLTFRHIRSIGKEAEQAMYQATGGVNTHKGAIFTLGILCAAAGRLSPEHWTPETLCSQCANMTAGVTAQDFAGITEETAKTAGERLYALYGIAGIRGQAEKGFPAVKKTGLPVLQKGLQQGLSLNDAGCATLLHLLTVIDDTNLIHRSDRQTQLQIKERIASVLAENPYPGTSAIEALDKEFIEKNLSAGGSADLLAATYFLHFLTQ